MIPVWPPGTVAVLATVGDDGAPHAIPVSTALRDGPDVLLALAPRRGSLARLRERPRVAVHVTARGLSVTLRGEAVDLGPLPGQPVHGVRVAVDATDDHDRPTFALEAPVAWRWTDEVAASRDAATRAALAALRRHPG